ncbi:BafA family autotransporter [Bartonella sp. B17]
MRRKYKLGVSILMISSCFAQVAGADESKKGKLEYNNKENRVMMSGGSVSKGSALITSGKFSNGVKILDGSVEVVENGGTSMNTIIEKGGIQIVTRGGNAIDTKILGGRQLVFEESNLTNLSGNAVRRSTASGATVLGANGSVGQQNVYGGGQAWKTTVGNGGEQNLYVGNHKKGGTATQTTVSGNGRQNVLDKGRAVDTTLSGNAIQVVYPGGEIDGLTISDFASSWMHVGTQISKKGIQVNGKGHLYLYAGDRINHITKKELSVTGRSTEKLFFVNEHDGSEQPWLYIEKLSGQGGTVSFLSIPYDNRPVLLRVENLSGQLHFHFDVSVTNTQRSYLLIGNGAGNHTISVVDSGAEIAGFLSQNNNAFPRLNLVTDRTIKGEGATFTLKNYSGKSITAVDGGAYMYSLRKEKEDEGYTVWYLAVPEAKQQSRDSSRSKSERFSLRSGDTRNVKKKPRSRRPRHLRENQLVSTSFPENQSDEILRSGDRLQLSNKKQQSVASSSLGDQVVQHSNGQLSRLPQAKQEIKVSDFLTSPSTDAVLSMSVIPGFIFHNELQVVRAGRGIVNGSKKISAFWTQAIKHKEHIATGHTDFKLDQTGIILGINSLSELMSGEFYVGGFGSYDQARVAHARGGTSSISGYSLGTYATYVDYSGWYLDTVFKYNHYQNDLNAVSTNGLDIHGNYNQWAIGASFETGYRFKTTRNSWMQPYGQLTWLQAADKEIKLSNKMIGDIGRLTSLHSEVGLSLGYEFGSSMHTPSMAYIMVAWVRENIDKNYTTINKQHKFITDLSGNSGKFGVGMNSFVSDRLMLFVEANYLKGQKIKQSFQGTVGIRYSF